MTLLAIDTETTGLELHHGCQPFMLSFCDTEGNSNHVQWRIDPETRKVRLYPRHYEALQNLLTGKTLVLHNAKFDFRALGRVGVNLHFPGGWETAPGARCTIDVAGYEETLLLTHVLHSRQTKKLKELGVLYLGYPSNDEKELQNAVNSARRLAKTHRPNWKLGVDVKGKNQPHADYWLPRKMWQEGLVEDDRWADLCGVYAEKDAERTMLLYLLYQEVLEDEDKRLKTIYQREKNLYQVVYNMEDVGAYIINSKLEEVLEELSEVIQDENEQAADIVEEVFGNPGLNPDSHQQIADVLFSKTGFGLTPKTFTEKGKPSTSKDVLNDLYQDAEDEDLKDFLFHLLTANANKSIQRYTRSYKYYAIPNGNPGFSKLHPSFNQVGARTTRFSSSQPNGQNISKKEKTTVAGQDYPLVNLRSMFGPPPSKEWYRIDYSQLELRVFAAVSQEQSLIQSFEDGHDFHGFVASKIFGKPPEEISSQERTVAKNTNFALIFGASPDKVNKTAGIDNAYELFAGQFPNAADFMDKTIARVKKTRHVWTWGGYKLDTPPDEPYKAVNYIVQGTAGDIIKNAMIDIGHSDLIDWSRRKIVLQIHDELILETDKDLPDNEEWIKKVAEKMVGSGEALGIKTPVDCKRVLSTWNKGESVCLSA